jgi:acyl carrier protein
VTDTGTTVTRDQIEEELKELLVNQFFVNPEDIAQGTHLIDDLGLDSLDLMAGLCTFEDRYSISVSNDEVTEMITFGACVDRLTARLQGAV